MSEKNGRKEIGYQPGNEQRGYQPSKSTKPKSRPAAPTKTPKGGSSGKK